VSGETERVRRIYDESAGRYDRMIRLPERILFGGGRQWVCSQARGEVLEVAIGTGRNLPFYPNEVRLTGVDLSPAMLAVARARGRELGVEADLRVADAQALPYPDQSFDTVVITLSLCTIPDDREAIGEASRALRPGGRLLLLEHVRSPVVPVQRVSVDMSRIA
jgi:ubiquinone/menaquinone biosynthesis C-methylase UbiE